MTLTEVVEALELQPATAIDDRPVSCAIVSDLLSEVLASGAPGCVWVTLQNHRNVAAVASTHDMAAVVLIGGRVPDPKLVELAEQENICVLSTPLPAFAVAGRLYELGLRASS